MFYLGDSYNNPMTNLLNSIKPATYEAPIYTAPDQYVAPDYDESRITDLTQTSSAGAIRGLRSAMQRVAGGSYANPNVRRMTLREALAGYGQGIQSAVSAASETARKLYNTEYETKAEEKKLNYNTAAQASQAQYQAGVQQSQSKFAAEQNRYNTEYATLWNNFNAEQNRKLEQQKVNIAQQEAETNKALAEAKLNPYGYGITRPPKGLDAYANARWFAAHGMG